MSIKTEAAGTNVLTSNQPEGNEF